MNQGALDFSATPAPATAGERFRAFHETNPQVYAELRDLALRAKRAGLKRYGMKGLFEVLRWNRALQTQGEPWLLNNNYTAHYARLLMERVPELRGFFETRRSVAGAASLPPTEAAS
jgi:hypothetical protein